MRFASAREIINSGIARKTVEIEGIDKPVEIIGLTQAGVSALTKISESDGGGVNAWLIKQCCPAFRWWGLSRINTRIPAPVVAELVKEIIKTSGLYSGAVEDAAKE